MKLKFPNRLETECPKDSMALIEFVFKVISMINGNEKLRVSLMLYSLYNEG